VRGFAEAVRQAGASAPDKKEDMWANSEFKDLVPYNDGFRTALIGTAGQVAHDNTWQSHASALFAKGTPGTTDVTVSRLPPAD